MSYGIRGGSHKKLSEAHRLMLIDMLDNPEPRELQLDLASAMKRRSHIRHARDETVQTTRPVHMGGGRMQDLPHMRIATFWELTRSGRNVAEQLRKLKRRHDGAREAARLALEAQLPPGTRVVVVYTNGGGQAYREDDAPDNAKIIARGTVVSVTGSRDIRVQVDEVTPVMVVEEPPAIVSPAPPAPVETDAEYDHRIAHEHDDGYALMGQPAKPPRTPGEECGILEPACHEGTCGDCGDPRDS